MLRLLVLLLLVGRRLASAVKVAAILCLPVLPSVTTRTHSSVTLCEPGKDDKLVTSLVDCGEFVKLRKKPDDYKECRVNGHLSYVGELSKPYV